MQTVYGTAGSVSWMERRIQMADIIPASKIGEILLKEFMIPMCPRDYAESVLNQETPLLAHSKLKDLFAGPFFYALIGVL